MGVGSVGMVAVGEVRTPWPHIRYVGEDLYSPGKSLSLPVAGLGEQYSYSFPWLANGINFSERILLLPALNDAHAFQVRGTAGIDVPITDNFSIDIDLLDDYLRNLSPTSLQNYAKVIFSLKYTIGAPPIPH